jgi:hypothetical protein
VATKASTIKFGDLAKAIDKAIEAAEFRKVPGGIICGRMVPPTKGFDANSAARQITREVQKSFPALKLTPKVFDGTMGFIIRNPPAEF